MSLTVPLVLDPVLVPKPWGGHRLAALGRHEDHATPTGESWDVADLPTAATTVADPVSRVVGGPHDGRSLGELLEADRAALLDGARTSDDGRFPLLVKVLDAAETLSVQVHPPRSLSPARFKTESWVVLDADDGAELLLGVRDGVTLDQVRAAAGTAALVDLLRPVPARAGDVVHVPAGTIHALGAGVLVAEVQTPSDVTHRLWDWPDQRDGGRELHVDAAVDAITAGWEHNHTVAVAPATNGRLVTTDAYVLDRMTVAAGQPLPLDGPTVAIVLDGALAWDDAEVGPRRRERTECAVLPAACEVAPHAGDDGATVLLARPTAA